MSIKSLPDQWRSNDKPQDIEERAYNDGQHNCAHDLIAALPVWTEITDSEDTLPPAGKPIMMISRAWPGGWYEQNIMTPLPTHWMYDRDHVASDRVIGMYWRPLCDLDTP